MTGSCEADTRRPPAFYQSVLAPHPWGSSDAVRAIEVRLARPRPDTLEFRYAVTGDPRRVRWPAPAESRRADGLWKHTCLEAFVAPDPGEGYVELNFSPSGMWACYAFTRYRAAMAALETVEAPRVGVTRETVAAGGESPSAAGELRWVLEARVRLASLSGGGAVRAGLAAVIEETDGRLSYWALGHPPGRPDFHRADTFALRI